MSNIIELASYTTPTQDALLRQITRLRADSLNPEHQHLRLEALGNALLALACDLWDEGDAREVPYHHGGLLAGIGNLGKNGGAA
jgi:hypothetical protein